MNLKMENQANSSNQSRFLIAAVLSMAILFGWQYFFAPKTPPANSNSNTAANTATNTAANTAVPAATQAPQPQTTAVTPDTTPNRTVTIKSDLYEVKLDSKGALPVSWILLKNKSPKGEYPLYADGSIEAQLPQGMVKFASVDALRAHLEKQS